MNVLCKIQHGSHLYGLNTEKSDLDYKGVFLPTLEDLILQTNSKHISLDQPRVDHELFSLHKFFDLLSTGQPVALEMLFAPREMILETSPLWENIITHRGLLLTKNVKAFTGYCRSQASKYCLKGERLKALEDCYKILQNYNDVPLEQYSQDFISRMGDNKYFSFSRMEDELKPWFMILNKKFFFNTKISTIMESLDYTIKKYGDRARLSRDMDGADWKAMSHAIRVAVEVRELLTVKQITLPLMPFEREYILRVKLGKENLEDVEDNLAMFLDHVDSAMTVTQLPEKFDREFANKIIKDAYENNRNI